MATERLGVIMHGVTGRMGLNQHLVRSILAIRKQGGIALPNGDRVMPDPILVGRNEAKVTALARDYGLERWTTDLAAALANPDDAIFFDRCAPICSLGRLRHASPCIARSRFQIAR